MDIARAVEDFGHGAMESINAHNVIVLGATKDMNETAWCRKHLTSVVDKNLNGRWEKQCRAGHKWSEKCEIVIEGGEKEESSDND